MTHAMAAATRGMRIRARGIASVLQVREEIGVERRELALNVVQDDPHDEDAGEEVEQDPSLDEKGHRLDEQEAEDEDPVLQQQIADNLCDGLSPGRQDEESRKNRREGCWDQEAPRVLGRERQAPGEEKREAAPDRAEEEGGDEADVRIDLLVDLHVTDRPEEEAGDDDSLDERGADRHQDRAPARFSVDEDREDRQERPLERCRPDADAKLSSPQDQEVREEDQDENQVGGLRHRSFTGSEGSRRRQTGGRPSRGAEECGSGEAAR